MYKGEVYLALDSLNNLSDKPNTFIRKTIQMRTKMERKFTDVFPIREPEVYMCRVHLYKVSHSQMYVQVEDTRTNKTFYVVFLGVYYFSGLLHWQGANFQIEEFEEMSTFIYNLNSSKKWEDVLLKQYKSYLIPNSAPETRVIAFNAFIVDQLPPEVT